MNSQTGNERLSQINTHWTQVLKAHLPIDSAITSETSIINAQQQVLNRYGSCIYRYLLGATRDQAIAEDLSQEFAFRFVRGDLKNVSPEKGRFRDYLKAVLRNIVNDHFRTRQKEKAWQFESNPDTPAVDPFKAIEQDFKEVWRENILTTTWGQLKEYQQSKQNHYFTVLRYRADHPESDSKEMAAQLSNEFSQSVTSDWVRQNLKRAREKFCKLLVAEVAKTLSSDHSPDELEMELAELRLLKYTNIRS